MPSKGAFVVSLVRKTYLAMVLACGAMLAAAPAEATECKITQTTSTCTINGALFTGDATAPTGTGVIDSFVRIQSNGAQDGWEQGYNTSDRPVEDSNNVKIDPNFTRDLTLGEVGETTIGSIDYYVFFLDVNEPAASTGTKYLITLDQLEIYVSDYASLNLYSGTANSGTSGSLSCDLSGGDDCVAGATSTKVYDMDGAAGCNPNSTCDNYVTLNYLVSGHGSGSGDMAFYIKKSVFAGYSDDDYVYLFSQFGDMVNSPKKYDGTHSQAGFEEWYTTASIGGSNTGPLTPVPEPASLLLVGTGLGMAARRWRKTRAA